MPDAATLARAHDFLAQHGTKQTPHGSRLGDLAHGSFDDHLKGTMAKLEAFGFAEPVCLAGLFHSIYGTEGFQGLVLPLAQRAEVAGLVGDRAEQCAFFNCVMDRDSLDQLVADHVGQGLELDTAPRLPLRARIDPSLGLTGDETWQLTPEATHDLVPTPGNKRFKCTPHHQLYPFALSCSDQVITATSVVVPIF